MKNSFFIRKFSALNSFFLLPMLLCFSFSACKKEDATTPFTKTILTSDFNTITINGVCDVYLVQDTFCGITVRGFEKWVNTTTANVNDTNMTIETLHPGEFVHPSRENTTVYVHFKTLKRINANEVCHIRTTAPLTGYEIGLVVTTKMVMADLALNCHVFYFWNNPNGTHLNLSGNVSELKLWCTGLSSIDAKELITDYALVENGTQGDISVRPTQTLDYSLTNTGNIYYYGNTPNIQPNIITGKGKLINAQ